ncbi:hypothetical protein D9M69_643170 [compost metagenome]
MRTSGWSSRAWPAEAPVPVTMFTTPAGRTLARIFASSRMVTGVSSDGLMTTVLPAAMAGAIFQAAISSGKFQGITWPTTPSGSLSTMLRVCSSSMTASSE